jgi:excisionase family DNA binding protein
MKTPGYTISQAARLLEVTRLTVYHWIESGRVIPVRTPTRYLIPHEQVVNIRLGIQ